VEDNTFNQTLLGRMLEKLGMSVQVADSGKAALQACAQSAFDLILMDVQMPDMDGCETTRQLRAAGGDAATKPILAVTANVGEADRQRCLDAGMNDVLPKPVEMATLERAIRRWLPATEAGSDDETVLDHETLAALRGVLGEGFADLIERFLSDVPARLARMVEALNAGETGPVGFEAHALKSSSLNLGAMKMAARCESLEILAEQGDFDGMSEALASLQAMFARVQAALLQEVRHEAEFRSRDN